MTRKIVTLLLLPDDRFAFHSRPVAVPVSEAPIDSTRIPARRPVVFNLVCFGGYGIVVKFLLEFVANHGNGLRVPNRASGW